MGDPIEDFEPLFDYRRVQPRQVVCLDDDDSDASPANFPKRAKVSIPAVENSMDDNTKDKKVLETEDKEEDWLLPPPKVSVDVNKMSAEDSTLKELRLKKQELASFALSAESLLRAVEESAKVDVRNTDHPSAELDSDDDTHIPPAPEERAKIVISVQDKEGLKQFRLFTDDKLERLFKMYADKHKLDPQSLAFSFDGDKISPEDTPVGLGMEDDDMIEVHVKSR